MHPPAKNDCGLPEASRTGRMRKGVFLVTLGGRGLSKHPLWISSLSGVSRLSPMASLRYSGIAAPRGNEGQELRSESSEGAPKAVTEQPHCSSSRC